MHKSAAWKVVSRVLFRAKNNVMEKNTRKSITQFISSLWASLAYTA